MIYKLFPFLEVIFNIKKKPLVEVLNIFVDMYSCVVFPQDPLPSLWYSLLNVVRSTFYGRQKFMSCISEEFCAVDKQLRFFKEQRNENPLSGFGKHTSLPSTGYFTLCIPCIMIQLLQCDQEMQTLRYNYVSILYPNSYMFPTIISECAVL